MFLPFPWQEFVEAALRRPGDAGEHVGEPGLGVALADLSGNLRFDNLIVDVNGVSSSFRQPGLQYGVTVAGNGFSDDRGTVRRGFFGSDHEEMAGILDDREVQLLAGFGGNR